MLLLLLLICVKPIDALIWNTNEQNLVGIDSGNNVEQRIGGSSNPTNTSIIKSYQTSNVRLTGGNGPQEGNVEVLVNGTTWMYVCDDGWDMRDAKVVCRELGYAKVLKATKNSAYAVREGMGDLDYNTAFGLTNLVCKGDEKRVVLCENGAENKTVCDSSTNVAGIVCSNIPFPVKTMPQPSKASGGVKEVKVRLIGESKHGFISSGYLEVLYNGVWGSVCADDWSYIDSYVACGNLGYPDIDSKSIVPKKKKEEKNHKVDRYLMTKVKCFGHESTLYECDHAGYKKHVCKMNKPVYLHCKRSPLLRDNRFDRGLISTQDVRLRSGYRHSEGRVEVKYNGEWGTICDDHWSIKNANVFCREVGFGTAFSATHEASFGQGSGTVWMDEVYCFGEEVSIQRCMHAGWNNTDCGHKEDAGVKCHYPYGKPVTEIRLHGHDDPLHGAVEVLRDGMWQGICGIGWGIREAEVVCRQLGLGFPQEGKSTGEFRYYREFAMYNVKCSGDELSLTHCHYIGPEEGRCRFYDAASVRCSPNAADLVMDVMEMKHSIQIVSQSLESLMCAYEERCLASSADDQLWNRENFNRTLLRFTARFWNRGTGEFRPKKGKEEWEWHACHRHYHSMERFADYDITDRKGNKVAEGHKASFCLEDYECDKGVEKKYRCGRRSARRDKDQGLKVNCADTYKRHLDCQWVDITNLRYDHYRIRVVLNPQNQVHESDYSNNIASCDLTYWRKGTVTVGDCRIHPCEKMSWGGVGDGACCKFPFIYNGKQHHSCIHNKQKEYMWCATTSDFDKDGLWGKC